MAIPWFWAIRGNRGDWSASRTVWAVLTFVILLLVVGHAHAEQWCFGGAKHNKKAKTCSGGGWVVVKESRQDQRIDCYLRTGKKNPGIYVTPYSVLFLHRGANIRDDTGNGIAVDKNRRITPDLVADRDGMEFSDPAKIALLMAQFRAGYVAQVSAAPNAHRYSLLGFTKASDKFDEACSVPSSGA